MALTLLEYAKLSAENPLRQGVIELYAGSSGILANLPFENITGNALKYIAQCRHSIHASTMGDCRATEKVAQPGLLHITQA